MNKQTEGAAESVERLPEHWQKLIDQAPSEESRAIALERALFAQKIQPYIQAWKDKVDELEAQNERLTAFGKSFDGNCSCGSTGFYFNPHNFDGRIERGWHCLECNKAAAQQAIGKGEE